jgi:hypothetical protein
VISTIDLLDTFVREIDAAGARTEGAKKDLMKSMKALWKEVSHPPPGVVHPPHISSPDYTYTSALPLSAQVLSEESFLFSFRQVHHQCQ